MAFVKRLIVTMAIATTVMMAISDTLIGGLLLSLVILVIAQLAYFIALWIRF